MSSFKEIVTKTVIGKGKKNFRNKYTIETNDTVDTVLGCWVINHNVSGVKDNEYVKINGSFDINIWYSYDNNTKTNVISKRVDYEEKVKVNLKDGALLSDSYEVILENLKNPNCVDVTSNANTVEYTIEKEIGIEIIGDAKVRITVEEDEDEYDIIEDEQNVEEALASIDNEVNEDYLEESE